MSDVGALRDERWSKWSGEATDTPSEGWSSSIPLFFTSLNNPESKVVSADALTVFAQEVSVVASLIEGTSAGGKSQRIVGTAWAQPNVEPKPSWDRMDRLSEIKSQADGYGLDTSAALDACISRLRKAVDLCDKVDKMLASYVSHDRDAVQSLLGPEVDLDELCSRGRLLAVCRDGDWTFPEFQFDNEHWRLRGDVGDVNQTLGAAKDPWGVAAWWVQPHGGLGCAPAELLGRGSVEHRRVLEAAEAVVERLD